MIRHLLISASMTALLVTTNHAAPGPMSAQAAHTISHTSAPIINSTFHKSLKKLGKKLNPLSKSTPSTPNVPSAPGNIRQGAVGAPRAPAGTRAPSGPAAFPQQTTPSTSWTSPTVRTRAIEVRTPAAKQSILANLNSRNRRGGMVYTESGKFRLKNGGARVRFNADGSTRIDTADVKTRWSPNEQRQIDGVANGDVSFQFRDSDNGVLRLVDRQGDEVFMNYTGNFVKKAGANTAVRQITPLAPSNAIAPPRTPPGSGRGNLGGQNQFSANQNAYDSVAPLPAGPPRYDSVPPQPPIRYDQGFGTNNGLPGQPPIRYDQGFGANNGLPGGQQAAPLPNNLPVGRYEQPDQPL